MVPGRPGAEVIARLDLLEKFIDGNRSFGEWSCSTVDAKGGCGGAAELLSSATSLGFCSSWPLDEYLGGVLWLNQGSPPVANLKFWKEVG